MKFSLSRALIIMRREYLTTVRRKAFVFSLMLTPAIMFVTISLQKAGIEETRAKGQEARVVALVDSSGIFASAPSTYEFSTTTDSVQFVGGSVRVEKPKRETIPLVARRFATLREATDSLDAGTVNTVMVVPADFLAAGGIRRYEKDTRALTGSADDRAIRGWMIRWMLSQGLDSTHIDRALTLTRTTDLYVPAKSGGYALKDDRRELWSFILPFALSMLLGLAIITGGQYLLQGITEEKETRILESMLCTVTPDELMLGKLLGLGGAGLTMVGIWTICAFLFAAPMLAFLNIELSPLLLVFAITYFLLGYLFYGSLMTGIGAIANNVREAQQIAIIFTMLNFMPIYAIATIINNPKSPMTMALSMFPPTAPATMMMRLSVSAVTGAAVPMWQVGASIGLLAITAFLALRASAKVFRIGLLLYGKTPNLPEIVKILQQK